MWAEGDLETTSADLESVLKRGMEAVHCGESYVVEAVVRRIGASTDSTWHEGCKLSERMNGSSAWSVPIQ